MSKVHSSYFVYFIFFINFVFVYCIPFRANLLLGETPIRVLLLYVGGMRGYVQMSRDIDNGKGDQSFGDPPISALVKGMKITWDSILSHQCVKDLIAASEESETSLSTCHVDDIM